MQTHYPWYTSRDLSAGRIIIHGARAASAAADVDRCLTALPARAAGLRRWALRTSSTSTCQQHSAHMPQQLARQALSQNLPHPTQMQQCRLTSAAQQSLQAQQQRWDLQLLVATLAQVWRCSSSRISRPAAGSRWRQRPAQQQEKLPQAARCWRRLGMRSCGCKNSTAS